MYTSTTVSAVLLSLAASGVLAAPLNSNVLGNSPFPNPAIKPGFFGPKRSPVLTEGSTELECKGNICALKREPEPAPVIIDGVPLKCKGDFCALKREPEPEPFVLPPGSRPINDLPQGIKALREPEPEPFKLPEGFKPVETIPTNTHALKREPFVLPPGAKQLDLPAGIKALREPEPFKLPEGFKPVETIPTNTHALKREPFVLPPGAKQLNLPAGLKALREPEPEPFQLPAGFKLPQNLQPVETIPVNAKRLVLQPGQQPSLTCEHLLALGLGGCKRDPEAEVALATRMLESMVKRVVDELD
ncbi:hypothetical protein PLICRDRAFT_29702 [Plicaturopsis crispa FD-325 SS-3]|nr:hypothetical protein PLICRDRAFT_29702 [Plicaturopsis crispa FD-325 SS-3]